MWSTRSTSTFDRSGAATRAPLGTLCGALLCGAFVTARESQAQRARPPVTVDVRIDGALYRSRMGDPGCTASCAALQRALVDSVRARLDRRFGFLDWRTGASPDTLRLAWSNAPGSQAGQIELTPAGHSVRGRPAAARLPFEPFNVIAERPRADWQRTDVMRASWLARLDEVLARPAESQAVVRNVLSRFPLSPAVTFDRQADASADVLVGLGPRAIRASPTQSPIFLVRMHVTDPANQPDIARRDTTEMTLARCSRAGTDAYRCAVDYVAYPERTPPDTIRTVNGLAELARRAKRQPVTLHLLTFFPIVVADDAPLRVPEE